MHPANFLVGPRVALRPLEPSDAPQVARWMNDPEVRRHLHTVRPESMAQAAERLSQPPRPDELLLGVVVRETSTLIGYRESRTAYLPSLHRGTRSTLLVPLERSPAHRRVAPHRRRPGLAPSSLLALLGSRSCTSVR